MKVKSTVPHGTSSAGGGRSGNTAEIYNKDGSKLDLFGEVDGLHYFSDDKRQRRRPDLHAYRLQRRNAG